MSRHSVYAILAAVLVTSLVTAETLAVSEASAGPMRIRNDAQNVLITNGQQEVLEYQYNPVPFKPYVKQFLSPRGVNVLRDAPHDHLHHHALMFAIAADGVDFWAETPQCGRQVHRQFPAPAGAMSKNGLAQAHFTEQLDWVNAQDQAILSEQRTIAVWRGKDMGASLLTWRTRLAPAGDRSEVKLSGSHYFGLGMRFVESMDKGGQWIYPEKRSVAEVVRGDERLVRATWCAYTAKANGNGNEVTVAMFDHPTNARHPAYWFTMADPFSYVSATTNLWKEPMALKKGESLNLVYGVGVWDGKATGEQIEKLYRQWVELAAD